MTKITIDLAEVDAKALTALAHLNVIPMREVARLILIKAGFSEEEADVVTMPGAKHRAALPPNGHVEVSAPPVARNYTSSDFIRDWQGNALTNADIQRKYG